jgi:hypothetical protein
MKNGRLHEILFWTKTGGEMKEFVAGWSKPENSRKWHYYGVDRRSLCGKWILLSGCIDEDNQTTDSAGKADCVICARKLAVSKLKLVEK